jgi:hypothetical protein
VEDLINRIQRSSPHVGPYLEVRSSIPLVALFFFLGWLSRHGVWTNVVSLSVLVLDTMRRQLFASEILIFPLR